MYSVSKNHGNQKRLTVFCLISRLMQTICQELLEMASWCATFINVEENIFWGIFSEKQLIPVIRNNTYQQWSILTFRHDHYLKEPSTATNCSHLEKSR